MAAGARMSGNLLGPKRSQHNLSPNCYILHAGLPSSTYNEIWQVVTGSPPGSATASAADLAALNGQAAALRTALARQATAGNNLVIADGVWTKGIKVNPEYASSMKSLFKVGAPHFAGWSIKLPAWQHG